MREPHHGPCGRKIIAFLTGRFDVQPTSRFSLARVASLGSRPPHPISSWVSCPSSSGGGGAGGGLPSLPIHRTCSAHSLFAELEEEEVARLRTAQRPNLTRKLQVQLLLSASVTREYSRRSQSVRPALHWRRPRQQTTYNSHCGDGGGNEHTSFLTLRSFSPCAVSSSARGL